MKKYKKQRTLPVSQRSLAAYLGVAPSLLNMAESGRHGDRQLSAAAGLKLALLTAAHLKPKSAFNRSASIIKSKNLSAVETTKQVRVMLKDADYINLHLPILKNKMDDMIRTQQEALEWIHTVDALLENLPKNKESANDRTWLENQRQLTFDKLRKNDQDAQLKLQVKIETEKAKARIFTEIAGRLLTG